MSKPAAERGFSLVEVLVVLGIVALLMRLSLPAFAAMRCNARAAQVVGDYNTVRAAAFAQYDATGSFPADAGPGVTPAGMSVFLPRGFSFHKLEYDLDWDHFAVSDSSAGVTGSVAALTVVAPDTRLGLTVLRLLGANCTHWSVGDAHTFVVQSTLESPR
jgi:prepilin-type N-terminal cleavage/methylation domain-containing protein